MQCYPKYTLNITMTLVMLLLSHPSISVENKDPIANLVKTDAVHSELKSSALFEGRGDGITTCPVTGEKITSKKLKAELYGRTVYFCCHGCLKAGLKTPDRFVKPTQKEQQKAVTAFLAKAQEVHSEEFCNE